MGGFTFVEQITGSDLQAAFAEASANGDPRDSPLHRMWGASAISQSPVLPDEAHRQADQHLHGDDLGTGRYPLSKGETVYGIPVTLPTREVTLTGLSGKKGPEGEREAVEAALAASKGLRKGETVDSIWLTGYSTPQARPNYGYNYDRSAPTPFSNGTAHVVIRKADAPTERTVTVKVTIDGDPGHSYEEQTLLRRLAAEKAAPKLKTGEHVSVTAPTDAARTYKVEAVAGKSKPVTRYVVSGSRQHGTFDTGLPTQAAARKHAVDLANTPVDGRFSDALSQTYTVEAVTRRDGGEPLVSVARRLVKTVHTVDVTIVKDNRAERTVDGWVVFGFAPDY